MFSFAVVVIMEISICARDMMGSKPIDLDSTCVLFDEKNRLSEAVFFNMLENSNKSVRHGGDNRTGEGEGDDEKIFIDLDQLPAKIKSAFIVVNCYSGEPLSSIRNAYCRVVDTDSKTELIRFELNTLPGSSTALLMCKLSLQSSTAGGPAPGSSSSVWMMKALGHATTGRMYKDNTKELEQELAGTLRTSKSDGFRFNPTPHTKGAAAPTPAAAAAAGPAAQSTNTLLYVVALIIVLAILYQYLFARDGVPQFNAGGQPTRSSRR